MNRDEFIGNEDIYDMPSIPIKERITMQELLRLEEIGFTVRMDLSMKYVSVENEDATILFVKKENGIYILLTVLY